MHNQDRLHIWWWGDNGPAKAELLTIGQIDRELQPALKTGVVLGKRGGKITTAGWNYAVLKFLIEKCTLPQSVNAIFNTSSNPKKGNYGIWRKHLNIRASVNPLNHMKFNGIFRSDTPSVFNTTNANTLKELIANLQRTIIHDGIDKGLIENSIKTLSDIGIQYDDKKYPPLNNTDNFLDTNSETPSNLAEALLWKLGKWQSYKDFAANYTNDNSKPTKQNVVFFAFARHLKDRNNPIYDQHVIRALWAICGNLTPDEEIKCKELLFDRNDKWKQVASGSITIECYELFKRHINELISIDKDVTATLLDRLLMPLGQAIKKSTRSYEEFHQICGWPPAD